MKIFVHLALDAFAAEALARADGLLRDVVVPDRERHVFVWAGLGEPPVRTDYWSGCFPDWEAHVRVPYDETTHGPIGLNLQRRPLADGAAASLLVDPLRSTVRDLWTAVPERLLGPHQRFEVVVILTGSLAHPATGALVVALLRGLHGLHEQGVDVPGPRFFCLAAGAASGMSDIDEAKARALAARSLLDMECLAAQGVTSPTLLAGEEPVGGAPSDRKTQAALCALALVGLTRDLAHGSEGLGLVDRLATGGFAAVGAYAIHSPATKLARLLAVRVARRCFELLAKQRLVTSLDEAMDLQDPPPSTKALLERVEGQAVERLWTLVSERSSIPWGDATTGHPTLEWFDLGRVRQLFQPVFEDKPWSRLMRAYGEERLRAIPLEDWNGALDELGELIENGLLPARRRQVAIVQRRVLRALVDALDGGMGRLFGETFRPAVGFEPHRVAQALLGRIARHVRAGHEKVETLAALRPGRKEQSPHRKTLADLRTQLRGLLSSVPSPSAVFLRFVPFTALAAIGVYGLPFHLGSFDSPAMRVLLGGLAALVAVAALWARQVESLKRRLLASYGEWLAAYRAAIDEEDEALRQRAYAALLPQMLDVLKWYFQGVQDEPPLPEIPRVPMGHGHEEPPPSPPADSLSRQDVILRADAWLRKTATVFAELEQSLLLGFQESRVETALPEIRVDDPETLSGEYWALFGGHTAAIQEEAALGKYLADVSRHAETAGGSWLPFLGGDDLWRRSFLLPPGTDLLKAACRAESSGFQFIETLRAYIQGHPDDRFGLASRIARLVGDGPVTTSRLFERYVGLSAPSLHAVGDDPPKEYVIAASAADPLASNLHARNSLGRGTLSLRLQVQAGLGAADVIFYPNDQEPVTPLGRAWRAVTSRGSGGDTALEPAVLEAKQ